MPNEKKKSYKEIAENNMVPRNILLKDLYEKLEQISETDMQARIAEIREALTEVNTRTAKMHRRMQAKKGDRDRSEEEIKKNAKEIAKISDELDEISLIGTRLENEAELLEYFPRVRATMQAIKSSQEKADQETNDARRTVNAQEKLLNAAQKAADKAREAEEKAKEIEAQIEELQSELDEAKSKGRKAKVLEGLEEEISEKEEEMAALGTLEDWKKAIDAVGEYETKLALAVQELNAKKERQAKLEHPWDTILKFKLWTEIGDMESKDISDLVGTKVEKPDAKWEQTPAKKDDQNKDKDKDKDKNTGRGQGIATNVEPEQEPHEEHDDDEHDEEEHDEEEHDEEEHDEEEHDDEEKMPDVPKTWSEKHKIIAKILPGLARWMEKRNAKKVEEVTARLSEEEKDLKFAKGQRISAESRIQAIELKIKNYEVNARNAIKQIIQKADERNPELKKIKDKLPSRKLEDIKQVAAMYIAKGDYTEEEMYELLEERASAEKKGKDDTYILTADGGYNEAVKNSINQQLHCLTVSQLEERKPYLEMLGVFTDEEMRDIEDKVTQREKEEKEELNNDLERARRDLIQARSIETDAERAYKETQVSASRQAHRNFAKEINGGEEIPTPEVEHIEAELVREGDYERSKFGDPFAEETDIGDPFAEEPADSDEAR